jgi:hypothetical protein
MYTMNIYNSQLKGDYGPLLGAQGWPGSGKSLTFYCPVRRIVLLEFTAPIRPDLDLRYARYLRHSIDYLSSL